MQSLKEKKILFFHPIIIDFLFDIYLFIVLKYSPKLIIYNLYYIL